MGFVIEFNGSWGPTWGQHATKIHQKVNQKTDRILYQCLIDFLVDFDGSNLQLLMTLSAKTVIFEISVNIDVN